MTLQKKLLLKTQKNGDMCDLTEKVKQIIRESDVQTGLVNIFNVGSTAAIGTIEFEPGLKKDLPALLNRLIPQSNEYGHQENLQDGNGHSHLQATTLGPELTLPIVEGEINLGTWQQIFHLECDVKPRIREIIVTVHGD
ncbi:MAG: secondary thiamine-phosphate synthase enzyme YjbQ [Planctomycetota bacterium]|nr:secondary thiamine-phosphate synthase enzyme YjbQ [Planctomycetota bacterium]